SGLYLINHNDSSVSHLSQPTLQNNTVLSVMQDNEGNIWGGLDNGITLINKKSPFRLFVDTFGEIGTVYCSALIDGIRYLGTNQGLYYKEVAGKSGYRLVPGTAGQVWSINYENGKLLVGHDRGTFLVEGTTVNLIWEGLGTWMVKRLGAGFLQGHYNGLSYLPDEPRDSPSQFLKDFDLSSRNIIVENDSIIWISHYHKGIFRLKLDKDFSRIENSENYPIDNKFGSEPQIFTINQEIYFSTESAIYRYERDKNAFSDNNELNQLTKGLHRISAASQVLEDGSWWTFGRDKLYYVTRDPFEQKLVLGSIPLPLENRNITKGFENISLIGKDHYLVGSNVGYIEFSLPLTKIPSGELSITAVKTAAKGENFENRPLKVSSLDLENKINNVKFHFSIPNFQKLTNIEYRYRLLNYSSTWSNWSESGTAEFENLPAGSYTFQVQGKSDENETGILSYQFSIARAWYLTNLAIAGYLILFIFGLLGIHIAYRRHHEKVILEREKNLRMQTLEAEQKVIKLQKEHLEKDMADKNEQLAASTMSLIRKNEFLSILKEELKHSETSNVKGVIKTIDKEISEEDNWKMFKEAFKNADKEFFGKIKSKHPELTSNDLRLCAYLRLNLSSKEIAPLINISVKSVEIKRYRLRKKMGLPREINLTDYIMEL
ncbi:MAG TPA: triple tyrosine motif-containing protein, partial [Gillisia sp.]|nr:triple tyrosine motif-containing protein [Gillisia sp.]